MPAGDLLRNQRGDDVSGATPNPLRWAINQLNSGGGGGIIHFAIESPGSTQTVTLNVSVPAISRSVNISGWSQGCGPRRLDRTEWSGTLC